MEGCESVVAIVISIGVIGGHEHGNCKGNYTRYGGGKLGFTISENDTICVSRFLQKVSYLSVTM